MKVALDTTYILGRGALEHLPRLLVQYQARPKQLKRTLGERPVFHFDTQRHLPAYVEVRPLLIAPAAPAAVIKSPIWHSLTVGSFGFGAR